MVTSQKMKFSIKDFFIKFDQICRNLRICSHLLNKSLMENFIFCAVGGASYSVRFIRLWLIRQNFSNSFIAFNFNYNFNVYKSHDPKHSPRILAKFAYKFRHLLDGQFQYSNFNTQHKCDDLERLTLYSN